MQFVCELNMATPTLPHRRSRASASTAQTSLHFQGVAHFGFGFGVAWAFVSRSSLGTQRAATIHKMGSAATGAGSGGAMSAIGDVAKLLESNYRKTTSRRLRMLDMFLVFVFATGVLQVCPGWYGLETRSWFSRTARVRVGPASVGRR